MWFQNKRSKERRLRQICSRFNREQANETRHLEITPVLPEQHDPGIFQQQRALFYQEKMLMDESSYEYLDSNAQACKIYHLSFEMIKKIIFPAITPLYRSVWMKERAE